MTDLNLFSCINSYKKKYKFYINVKFNSKSVITKRTMEISEMFGIGLDEEFKFTLFDNFLISFDEQDIVYITGDSGSGKSVLVKEIIKQLNPDEYVSSYDLEIDNDEVLIENVGKDLNEALKILSTVGLNDAFLFLRRFKELSEGQKLRYKIAKMIDSNKKIFIFDEFCSTIDRETSRIIAFNIQKYIRRNNKILIVATTHNDLGNDLGSSVYLYKKFNNEYVVDYKKSEEVKSCSIVQNIEIKELNSLRYIEELEKYHYRQTVNSFKRIIGLYLNKDLVGFLVIAYPLLNLKGRNVFLDNKFAISNTATVNLLNREVEYISRVVIHPKYRGIGLAHKLVKEYLENYSTARYVESIAVMPKYNPFFEKAGMTRVILSDEKKQDMKYDCLLKDLVSLGFDKTLLKSSTYLESHYNTLDDSQKEYFTEVCEKLLKRFNGLSGSDLNLNLQKSKTKEYFEIIKKCIKSDLQYLVYDNTEKYNQINKCITRI